MADLTGGMLVEISGLPGKATPVPEASGLAAADLNGQRAQLMSYDRDSGKWIATTFNGNMIAVGERYLRALAGHELTDYDFVMGPKSDFHTVGADLSQVLGTKGYAVMKLFVSEQDASEMSDTAQKLDDDAHFSRLAVEFERGYLGKEGSAKTMLLNPDSHNQIDYVKASALQLMDTNFTALSQMLGPYAEDCLGFDVYSRTNMLLSMPLDDGDEDKYPTADIDDGDAEGYMHTMVRKKVSMLQFVGPSAGTITLVPTEEGGETIQLKAEPHTVLLVVANRYEYSYEPAPKSMALTAFILSEPATYSIENMTGNMNVLNSLGMGPPAPPGDQISVCGQYCRYGTGADGRFQFWTGVGRASTDGVTEIPFTRWDHTPYYDPDSTMGGSYTRHSCVGIEGVDLFDCKFFDIGTAEAKGMDPAQRQVMEVSYMALLEGGWDKKSLQREPANIGHFVGIDKDDWMCMNAAGMLKLDGAHGAAAAANSITANRFSYTMNLKGASMTIDTACSSSLVCTHVAKLHLRFKDNDIMPAAIVNGLNIILYVGPFIGCCAAGMLSHEGRCFTFNSTADGYTRGELCGASLFKNLLYDPDKGSLCCLAGSQVNQDGRSASMTAPNGPAQEKCLQAVLKEVKITPSEVDCFECHGTGTSLGDPIEVGSFKKVMSVTPRLDPLVMCSNKSNIAHGEGGAGMAGFIKSCLQVMHCEGCPNVHLRARNPHLDMEGFPCQMLSERVVCREDSAYCGCSSFGFGGTNAHCEAWARNIMTSRGTLNQDTTSAFQKKLQAAPPAEITMNGDDPHEWETTGLDPRAVKDARYSITLDEDGVVEWEKNDDDVPDFGDDFFLQGTHNGWICDALERHDTIPGLWVGEIRIGTTGEEEFQIVSDNDTTKVFHPGMSRCRHKAAYVKGPEDASREKAWLVSGSPGDEFTIEFFQQDRDLSVLWLKK